MTWTVTITPEAKSDIQEGINWYNGKQKDLGKRFHKEIKNCIALIEKHPFYAVKYEHIRCLIVRKFPYLIHYIVNESNKTVIILGVLHTSLNPNKNWFFDR